MAPSETEVARLLAAAFRDKATGTLRVQDGEVLKSVFIKNGGIMFGESNQPEDRLGEVLIRQGKLTRSQLDEAWEAAKSLGIKLGAALIQKGFIDAGDLVPAVTAQIEYIVLSLFAGAQGRGEFKPDVIAYDKLVNLNLPVPALLRRGIMDFLPAERLARLAGGPSSPLHKTEPPPDDWPLEAAEASLLAHVDGKRTASQVLEANGDGGEMGKRLLALLSTAGFIRTAPAAGEKKPAARRPSPQRFAPRREEPRTAPWIAILAFAFLAAGALGGAALLHARGIWTLDPRDLPGSLRALLRGAARLWSRNP